LLQQQDGLEKKVKGLSPWQHALVYFNKLDLFQKA
jgi:hypothetical protein